MKAAARRVLAGFPGTWPGPELKELLGLGVGGLVLFSRNIESPEQVAALLQEIHAMAAHPLVISIDQEGGRVARLKEPLTVWPPASTYSALSPELAQRAGAALASELLALGFNLNFAPNLDLLTHPENAVVGDRAFGANASSVVQYAGAWNAGARSVGLGTCGKHAPGHGPTTADSHEELPIATVGADQLWKQHLAPFVALAPQLDSMMTAHVLYADLDPRLPASLSPTIIAALRQRCSFDRLILCDALEMGALASLGPMRTLATLALKAGNDLLLACTDPADAEACVAASQDATSSSEAREHCERSLQRLDAFLNEHPHRSPQDPAIRRAILGCPAHQDIARQLWQHAPQAQAGPPSPVETQ